MRRPARKLPAPRPVIRPARARPRPFAGQCAPVLLVINTETNRLQVAHDRGRRWNHALLPGQHDHHQSTFDRQAETLGTLARGGVIQDRRPTRIAVGLSQHRRLACPQILRQQRPRGECG